MKHDTHGYGLSAWPSWYIMTSINHHLSFSSIHGNLHVTNGLAIRISIQTISSNVFKYLDFLSPKFVNTSDRLGLRKKWSISLLLGNCELAISVCLREKIQKFPTGQSCCFWNVLNTCWKTVLRRFKHANTFLHLLHFLPRMRQFPHSFKKVDMQKCQCPHKENIQIALTEPIRPINS